MAKVIILGTASAVAYKDHENTHMVFIGDQNTVLVDCVGNPAIRLPQVGVEFKNITDLILTHFHPDHVAAVPIFLMDMWLLGRQKCLNIYGLEHTISRVHKMMDLYSWQEWPNFFPVVFHVLPESHFHKALENEDFMIQTAPVQHLVPTVGMRVDFKKANFSVAYSCDTEPDGNVVRLAQGAAVLIHEAAGAVKGHSSAAQAAEIAQKAGVEHLYLIHYPETSLQDQSILMEARKIFSGEVAFAEDLQEISPF